MKSVKIALVYLSLVILLAQLSIAQDMTPTYQTVSKDNVVVGFYKYDIGMCISTTSCLNTKDASLFYLSTCPHCHNQFTQLGGEDNVREKFECSINQELCIENNIQAVPTWKINDRFYQGVQSAEKLNSIAGCLI